MRCWSFLFVLLLGSQSAAMVQKRKFSSLGEDCFASWNVTKSITSSPGSIGCASHCFMENDKCHGYLHDEDNQICDLVHIPNGVICSNIPNPNNLPVPKEIRIQKPQSLKSGLYIALPHEGKAYPSPNMDLPNIPIPMEPDDLVLAITYNNGILGCTGDRKCWFWEFGSKDWVSIAKPKVNHFLGKLVLLSGQPLLIGGCSHGDNGCSTKDEVEVYDSGQDSWSSKTPIPKSMRGFTATVVDDGSRVIIAGGMHHGAMINDVFSYRLEENVWRTLKSLPRKVCCQIGALVALPDDRSGILVLGGYNREVKNWPFFFDLGTNEWEDISNFEIPGTLVYDGEMFIAGSQLFVIPNYERCLRNRATRILSRNMTDINGQWVVHENLVMTLGKNSQVGFEITEYQYN